MNFERLILIPRVSDLVFSNQRVMMLPSFAFFRPNVLVQECLKLMRRSGQNLEISMPDGANVSASDMTMLRVYVVSSLYFLRFHVMRFHDVTRT